MWRFAEAWHLAFAQIIGSPRSTTHTFFKKLQREQSQQELVTAKLVVGGAFAVFPDFPAVKLNIGAVRAGPRFGSSYGTPKFLCFFYRYSGTSNLFSCRTQVCRTLAWSSFKFLALFCGEALGYPVFCYIILCRCIYLS